MQVVLQAYLFHLKKLKIADLTLMSKMSPDIEPRVLLVVISPKANEAIYEKVALLCRRKLSGEENKIWE